MFLKHKTNGDLVEVLDLNALFDPTAAAINGRFHSGEEIQEPSSFNKTDLIFPSGEALPKCWVDAHYRD